MNVEILRLSDDQRPVLRSFYAAVRREAFPWLVGEPLATADFDRDTDGEIVHVAWIGKTVAGFISVWAPDSFVHHLYVGVAHRRKGVARSLVHAGLKRLPGPVRLKCQKKSTAALQFYLQEGWQIVGEGESNEGEYILMEYGPDERGARELR